MTRLIFLLALGQVLCAQSADEILHRYFEAMKVNGPRAAQYTYVEDDTHFSYDKTWVARQTSSETYDVIFVEGANYKKLVARNGQPLSARDRAKEEKKLQDEARERRKQRRSGLFHHTFTVSDTEEDMLALFENRVVGEEEVNGHKTWVIESEPRAGRKPANDHERDALSLRRKLWVDQAENFSVRSDAVVVGDKTFLKPGTRFTIEWAKINNDAWLMTSFIADVHIQLFKFAKENGRQETKNSRFQKFDVQSTITVDPTP